MAYKSSFSKRQNPEAYPLFYSFDFYWKWTKSLLNNVLQMGYYHFQQRVAIQNPLRL